MVMIWYQAKGEQLIAVVGEKDKTFLLSGIEAGINILYSHGSWELTFSGANLLRSQR